MSNHVTTATAESTGAPGTSNAPVVALLGVVAVAYTAFFGAVLALAL